MVNMRKYMKGTIMPNGDERKVITRGSGSNQQKEVIYIKARTNPHIRELMIDSETNNLDLVIRKTAQQKQIAKKVTNKHNFSNRDECT
jgi:hypothetical protein